MARFPFLNADGTFQSAQVKTQLDARTDARMRDQLPVLAEELGIGGGSGGGVYYDATGKAVKYVYVVSDTDPGKTRVVDGETVEVWWVQTTPPDPMQSTPIGVKQDLAARSYMVPVDPVATYTINGVAKVADAYTVTAAAQTIQWAAVAKPGYGFKAGATTSGSLVFPLKTYAVGDVLMSDSFNRADGPLVGTASDSFAGGAAWAWVSSLGNGGIVSGAVKPSETFFRPEFNYTAPQKNVRVEFSWKTINGNNSSIDLLTGGRAFSVRATHVYATMPDGNKWYTPNLPTAPDAGDHMAVYSQTTADGYRQWFLENITKGQKVTSTTPPATGHVQGGGLDNTGLNILGVQVSLRGDSTPVPELDWIKVVQA